MDKAGPLCPTTLEHPAAGSRQIKNMVMQIEEKQNVLKIKIARRCGRAGSAYCINLSSPCLKADSAFNSIALYTGKCKVRLRSC